MVISSLFLINFHKGYALTPEEIMQKPQKFIGQVFDLSLMMKGSMILKITFLFDLKKIFRQMSLNRENFIILKNLTKF